MTILLVLKYPPNRRTFLYPLSPVKGTVDLTSCYSHEEASVLYWTLLHSLFALVVVVFLVLDLGAEFRYSHNFYPIRRGAAHALEI